MHKVHHSVKYYIKSFIYNFNFRQLFFVKVDFKKINQVNDLQKIRIRSKTWPVKYLKLYESLIVKPIK